MKTRCYSKGSNYLCNKGFIRTRKYLFYGSRLRSDIYVRTTAARYQFTVQLEGRLRAYVTVEKRIRGRMAAYRGGCQVSGMSPPMWSRVGARRL